MQLDKGHFWTLALLLHKYQSCSLTLTVHMSRFSAARLQKSLCKSVGEGSPLVL